MRHRTSPEAPASGGGWKSPADSLRSKDPRGCTGFVLCGLCDDDSEFSRETVQSVVSVSLLIKIARATSPRSSRAHSTLSRCVLSMQRHRASDRQTAQFKISHPHGHAAYNPLLTYLTAACPLRLMMSCAHRAAAFLTPRIFAGADGVAVGRGGHTPRSGMNGYG